VDLLGCKQPSDFIDEGRRFGSEQGSRSAARRKQKSFSPIG
jgi:hypothetical protein